MLQQIAHLPPNPMGFPCTSSRPCFFSLFSEKMFFLEKSWGTLRQHDIPFFYIFTDVVNSGADDFETAEDLHDAVGHILQEAVPEGGDCGDIDDVCNQLFSLIKRFVSLDN